MSGFGQRTTILQGNIDHCRAAQNLFSQVMVEWLVGVAVLAEPYLVPANWLNDRDSLVAIAPRFSTDLPPLSFIERGHGYVVTA